MEMDLLGNASFLNDTVNSVAGSGVNSLANLLSGRGFVQWILRSLSYCLYLANPYQETFQTEEEIPPYDIEVSHSQPRPVFPVFNQPHCLIAVPILCYCHRTGNVNTVVPR